MIKISTLGVITKGLPSPCSRSKMVTVLVDTPTLSGHQMKGLSMLLTVRLCCSTCLVNVTFPTKEQDKRYAALNQMDLILVIEI
jgi:hypothetical protein